MNRRFTYKWIDSNIIVTFEGNIGFDDIMEANNVIVGDIRFNNMKYQIFDYSHIKSIDLEKDVAKIISSLDLAANVWNNKVKVATVTSDTHLKEMILMYNRNMEKSSWVTETFDNIEDAIVWCTK